MVDNMTYSNAVASSIRWYLLILLSCLPLCYSAPPARIFGCLSRCGNIRDLHPLQPGEGSSHSQLPHDDAGSEGSQSPLQIQAVNRAQSAPSSPGLRWPDPAAGPQRIRISGRTREVDYLAWLDRPDTRRTARLAGSVEHTLPIVLPYFQEVGLIVFNNVWHHNQATVRLRVSWLELDHRYMQATGRLLDRMTIAVSLHRVPVDLSVSAARSGNLPVISPVQRHYTAQEYVEFQYSFDYHQEQPLAIMHPLTYSLLDLWHPSTGSGHSYVRHHYTVVWFDSPVP